MNLTETIRNMKLNEQVEIEEASNAHYTHEIDVAYPNTEHDQEAHHAANVNSFVSKLKQKGFHAKVSKLHGPAAVAAVIHLGHPEGDHRVHEWIKKHYDSDHTPKNDLYKIGHKESVQVGGGATGASKAADPTNVKAKAPGASKDQGDKNIINPPEHGLNLATDETDAENNTKPTADTSARNKASVAMKASAAGGSMKEHMSAMFDGENLSEDFMEKASTLFEAAVSERVSEITADLEEQFTNALNEKLEEIEQTNIAELEELTGKLDEYLSYAVEQWMQENELAVEHSLRSEITEEFIGGLRTLFAENYIDIPEEKFNVVEELSARVQDLEEKLNEAINENIELTASLNEMTCDEVFDEVSEGLATTQVEKFKKLAEGVEYDSIDNFKKKLEIIKESYFSTGKVVKKTSGLLEESFEGEEEKVVAGPMAHYVKAISRNIVK